MYDFYAPEYVAEELAGVLSPLLVGRKVVEVDTETSTLTLDDGTELVLEGYGGCCAWAEVDTIKKVAEGDNIITSVNAKEGTVFLLGSMVEAYNITVDADEGTGYYSFGIEVSVRQNEL